MINSVVKAIRILNLFSATQPRLSLAEISARLDMPKSTTHNLLNTLLSQGFIEKVDGDAYALGTAPLVLTQRIRVNVELRDPAAPYLRALADTTHESVYLTILDHDRALYIYAVESPRRLEARTAVGDRAHLHCTSVGKAILAYLPEARVRAILDASGLPRFTANTMTTWSTVQDDLAAIRAREYSIDNAEHEPGTYCLGAPIFNAQGSVIGSCSISGADPAIVEARRSALATQLLQTAHQISRLQGYVPARTSAFGLERTGQ